MSATIDAPPAPASPAVAPAAPAAPPPGATDGGPGTEIHVTPGTVDKGPKQDPPKKGSAMDRMMKDLRAKAKPQFFEESPPATSPETPSPAAPEATPASGEPTPKAAGEATTPAASSEEKKSKSPWKLVEEYKARAAKAETETLELRKAGVDPNAKKAFEEQITNLRKQNEELEKHIRYVDYQKSSEFKTKYKDPYEKAWERAAKEVAEIRVTDGQTGESRPANVNDLYAVVVAPLNEARDLADTVFGKFADDVMAYRKEIRALNEAQETALKEARDQSIERDKQAEELRNRFMTQTGSQIKELWDAANHEFAERQDLAFIFKPPETDEEHKSRLQKGYELVDKAFAVNSADPRLTPEQRKEAVKLHAAVRMRAAGFGPLRAKHDAALKKISDLEKELASFKGTVPSVGGSTEPNGSAAAPAKPWDRLKADLQKIARPVG